MPHLYETEGKELKESKGKKGKKRRWGRFSLNGTGGEKEFSPKPGKVRGGRVLGSPLKPEGESGEKKLWGGGKRKKLKAGRSGIGEPRGGSKDPEKSKKGKKS